MNHIMVDLETRGTVPGCIFMSLGLVAFDPTTGEMDHDGVYKVVSRESCADHYLSESKDTMDWWKKQAPEARAVLGECEAEDALKLPDALRVINAYVIKYGGFRDAKVWGNGADFDNAILAAAFDAAKMKPAWAFWNNRCYRTAKNLPGAPRLERREGTYHNALDDARTQAAHLIEIYRALGWSGSDV